MVRDREKLSSVWIQHPQNLQIWLKCSKKFSTTVKMQACVIHLCHKPTKLTKIALDSINKISSRLGMLKYIGHFLNEYICGNKLFVRLNIRKFTQT
jgi:hypothetical protein